MLKSVQAILHPPELKGRERRRYWLAVAGWLAITLSLLLVMGGGLLGIVWLCELVWGAAYRQYEELALLGLLIGGVVSVIYGDRLWYRLFIRSGYLSDAATIRLLSNRAPTRVSERRHRWLGQAWLLAIYGIFGFIAVWHEQWWVLVIVVPLAIWGVFLIRNAWKEADDMLKGGTIPPAAEERMRYIEKVLDDRSQNK